MQDVDHISFSPLHVNQFVSSFTGHCITNHEHKTFYIDIISNFRRFFCFVLGVDDDDTFVDQDLNEYQSKPQTTIDTCKMTTLHDDNTNDDDSICESFYSGKCM